MLTWIYCYLLPKPNRVALGYTYDYEQAYNIIRGHAEKHNHSLMYEIHQHNNDNTVIHHHYFDSQLEQVPLEEFKTLLFILTGIIHEPYDFNT